MSKHEPATTYPTARCTQRVYRFENGFGASVITDPRCTDAGFWELAVVVWNGDHWHQTYATPITRDVIPNLSEQGVDELLDRIAALPAQSGGAK